MTTFIKAHLTNGQTNVKDHKVAISITLKCRTERLMENKSSYSHKISFWKIPSLRLT